MNGIVAYSRPRGIYGRYVFTVVINYSFPKEAVTISVKREQKTYSCNSCGKWATIKKVSDIPPTQHQFNGEIEFYRFDNVEPGDVIYMLLEDGDLIYYQYSIVKITQHNVVLKSPVLHYSQSLNNDDLDDFNDESFENHFSSRMYDMFLINWDEHLKQNDNRDIRVEEDLIIKTMNAEPITIKELLLQSSEQPLELESGKHFIEGQLKYL